MASVHRVVLLVLAALFASSANASFPPPQYLYQVPGASNDWLSAQATCNNVLAYLQANQAMQNDPRYTYVAGNPQVRLDAAGKPMNCWSQRLFNGDTSNPGDRTDWFEIMPGSCPAGSTGTTSCTCTAPKVQNSTNDACAVVLVDPVAKCAALNSSADPRTYSTGYGLGYCSAGVMIRGTSAMKDATGSGSTVFGPYACTLATNSVCPADSAGVASPPFTVCPQGQVSGTVNGLTVCAPPANRNTISAGTSTVATAGADGVVPPIEGAPAGSTGSSTVTNCAAGACMTTTTYTGAGGGVTGTKEAGETESSYCQKNPVSPVCKGKENSAFSGTCSSPAVCSGDAIQCAVAAQSLKTACAFESTAEKSTEENAYTTGILKTGDQTTDLVKNPAPVSLSAGSFDQTELLGAAVGMSDLTVTVFRSTVTLPFSNINIWLQRLGMMLQAVTFLLCMRIVARG